MRNATLRRRLMHAQLDLPGMPPHHIIDGSNMAEMSETEIEANYDGERSRRHLGRNLTVPEVGCALSHIRAFQKMLQENISVALVLEDDALIGHQLLRVLEALLPQLDLSRSEIVLLTHVGRYSAWGAKKIDKLHSLFNAYSAFGAHGYLVTQPAAAALVNQLYPIYTVADDWRNIQKKGIARVQALVPYCIGTSILANASQIGTERFNLDARSKLIRYYRKYVYKKFFFQFVEKPLRRLRKTESTW